MPPAGFETLISASKWPQTHTLDGAVTGTVYDLSTIVKSYLIILKIYYVNSEKLFKNYTTEENCALLGIKQRILAILKNYVLDD
jgi:hypothetical protein